MMDLAVDIVSWACIVVGAGFALTGGIGMLRLPDVYTRAHAASITETMAAGLFLGGLMVQAGFTQVTVKLILILVFLFFTSPTATHALIHSAHASGLEPILGDRGDGDPGDSSSKTS